MRFSLGSLLMRNASSVGSVAPGVLCSLLSARLRARSASIILPSSVSFCFSVATCSSTACNSFSLGNAPRSLYPSTNAVFFANERSNHGASTRIKSRVNLLYTRVISPCPLESVFLSIVRSSAQPHHQQLSVRYKLRLNSGSLSLS